MRPRVVTWRDPSKPKRAHPEQKLHIAVARYLNAVLAPPAWFTSIAHGSRGGDFAAYTRGATWRGMGAKGGVPDILIIAAGRCFWLELKAAKGSLSEVQRRVHDELIAAGCSVAVCRSIDDVGASLSALGIPTREHKPDHVMDGLRQSLAAQGS